MTPRILFYDLETTGLNPRRHGIWQLAGLIYDCNKDQVITEFDYKMKPLNVEYADPKALKMGGITMDDLKAFPDQEEIFEKFKNMLGRYVDKYNPKDKLFLGGYNILSFDNQRFREWFLSNEDKYFGSWFYSGGIDVLSLAQNHLKEHRPNMPNFKLGSVAEALDVKQRVGSGLHDAITDIYLTFDIYKSVTG